METCGKPMPDMTPLNPFDVAEVIAGGGALGGFVDFCRQLHVEGSIRKKTFMVKYDEAQLGASSVIVRVLISIIIGIGGAFGVQFVLIMLKSFSSNTETANELLLFSVSIVAGIGARSLIPKISDQLQQQLFKTEQKAENAVNSREGCSQAR